MSLNKMKIIMAILGVSVLAMAGSRTVDKVTKPGNNFKETTMSVSNAVNEYDLNFDVNRNYSEKTVEVDGRTIKYRAYENIVYVKNPVDINYQTMNIYIPEEYFNGKSVGRYNARTAPIFFPNSVGGYMPGAAGTVGVDKRSGKNNASAVALSKGYVVAAPGARGRTLKDDQGNYTGKAPAAIVDLKAAVRYLRYNDRNIPGRSDRIISNGTSAGGALSALLGATGNSKDYGPYLTELGAAKATDEIYAVSAYCPITDLDHGNEAYEWMFNGIDNYKKVSITMLDYNVERKIVDGKLTEAEKKLSPLLKALFPQYVNSLKLRGKDGRLLTLDKEGNGSFKEYVKKYVISSADKALANGTDMSGLTFLTIKDNKVTDVDFEGYVKYIGRMKTPGAFDNVDLSTGENNLFGDNAIDNRHFTRFIYERTAVNGKMADARLIKMMNPIYYIGTKEVSTSKHWRIRHGAADRDTALSIPVILTLKLENTEKHVDFEAPWGQGHGGDYDLEELFAWMDKVVEGK